MQIAPLGKALEHREGSRHCAAYTHPASPEPDVAGPSRMRPLVLRGYRSIFLLFIISNYMTQRIRVRIIPNQDLLKQSRK